MDSTNALILFFGLFWSSVLSAVAPFQVFDTRMLFRSGQRRRGWCRLFAGILVVDLYPALLLLGIIKLFPQENPARPLTIVASAMAGLSVFSVQRFLHSLVATKNGLVSFFYDEAEQAALEDRKKFVEPFREHFIPGIGYLVFSLLMAMLFLWLQ